MKPNMNGAMNIARLEALASRLGLDPAEMLGKAAGIRYDLAWHCLNSDDETCSEHVQSVARTLLNLQP